MLLEFYPNMEEYKGLIETKDIDIIDASMKVLLYISFINKTIHPLIIDKTLSFVGDKDLMETGFTCLRKMFIMFDYNEIKDNNFIEAILSVLSPESNLD